MRLLHIFKEDFNTSNIIIADEQGCEIIVIVAQFTAALAKCLVAIESLQYNNSVMFPDYMTWRFLPSGGE